MAGYKGEACSCRAATNRMTCQKCGATMRIVAVITTAQQHVIDRILIHLELSTEQPKATGPSKWLQILQAQEHERMYQIEAKFHPIVSRFKVIVWTIA